MENTNPILRVLIYLLDESPKISQPRSQLRHTAEEIMKFLKTKIKSPANICQHIAADSLATREDNPWSVAAAYDHCLSCPSQLPYAYSYDIHETAHLKGESKLSLLTEFFSKLSPYNKLFKQEYMRKSAITQIEISIKSQGSAVEPLDMHHYYDVVIFLGHSGVLDWESSAVESLMKLCAKVETTPTIIAILGFCEGTVRYGSILKMSLLLDNITSPIIGLYQRRINISSGELELTSLLHGIRYYLHLQAVMLKEWKELPQIIRICYSKAFAKFAFGLAMCSAPANDPTLFINDTDKKGLIQQLLDKCKLTRKDVPLSCLQLAMYSPMIVDSNRAYSEIDIKQVNLKSAGELDKWCRHKIREQQLHKLIPLIGEIGLLNLTKDTLKLMESGDTNLWKKIDHLQFLITALRGHWGINSFAVIKEWATFHLMEAMRELELWLMLKNKPDYVEYKHLLVYSTKVSWSYDYTWHIDNLKIQLFRKEVAKPDHRQVRVKDQIECCIHRYKLCCMCYTLMSGDHFVRFVKPHEQYHRFGILACTKMRKPYLPIFNPHQSMLSATDEPFNVTPDGYIGASLCFPKSEVLPHVDPFCKETALPWDKSSNYKDVSKKDTTSWKTQSYSDEKGNYKKGKGNFVAATKTLGDVTTPKPANHHVNDSNIAEDLYARKILFAVDLLKTTGLITTIEQFNTIHVPQESIENIKQDNQNKVKSVFAKFLNPKNNCAGGHFNHCSHSSFGFSAECILQLLMSRLSCRYHHTKQSQCDGRCFIKDCGDELQCLQNMQHQDTRIPIKEWYWWMSHFVSIMPLNVKYKGLQVDSSHLKLHSTAMEHQLFFSRIKMTALVNGMDAHRNPTIMSSCVLICIQNESLMDHAQQILNFLSGESLIKICSYICILNQCNSESITSSAYDVVIFLVHSQVHNWDLSAIESLMKLCAKEETAPNIVAILGCCGGNTRYGNILKMSLLLDSKISPIIGFYQRCVYINELVTTSLLRGIRFYIHLQSVWLKKWKKLPQIIRICYSKAFAKFAFKLAMCSAPANDPTLFINDTDKKGLIQQLLDKCKLTRKDVPLSCLQLAMYSPMIVDSNRAYSEIDINQVNLKSADELDKWCRHKIREQQLHKLIPLICEIGLLNLTKDTLKLMESGDTNSWKKIDHLQFLIAALRGHWGINSFAVIKEWATFHLMKAMKVKPQDGLHQYHLCCVCFVLLSNDHLVRFVKPDKQYHQFGILACTRVKNLCPLTLKPHQSMLSATDKLFDMTPDGYIGISMCFPKSEEKLLPHVDSFPKERTLPWDELFQHCSITSNLVDVFRKDGDAAPWKIKSYGDETVTPYEYKKGDFVVAMRALSDKIAPKSTSDAQSDSPSHANDKDENSTSDHDAPSDDENDNDNLINIESLFANNNQRKLVGDEARLPQNTAPQLDKKLLQSCYCIKNFYNKPDMEHGMMTFFKRVEDYKFYEMRVMVDSSKTKLNKDSLKKELNLIISTEPFKILRVPQGTIENITNQDNQRKVKSCRFVFAKFQNPGDDDHEIEGLLYYTDNHYGHNLIVFSDEHINRLQHDGKCIKDFGHELELLQGENIVNRNISLCCKDCELLKNYELNDCGIKIQECVTQLRESQCNNNCTYELNNSQLEITLLCEVCKNGLQKCVQEELQNYGQCKKECGHTLKRHQGKSFLNKLNLLCGHCKYKMQQYIIDEYKNMSEGNWRQRMFPFVNTGRLILKYNTQPGDYSRQLEDIELHAPATGHQL